MSGERAYRYEERAKRQWLRVIRKIIGIALALVVGMWWFIGWSLWSESSAARAIGRTQGYNLTAAVASELTMTFDSINAALRLIDSDIKAIPAGNDSEHLRQAIDAVTGPDSEVRIVGPDGRLVYSSHRFVAGSTPEASVADFSHQTHFAAHRDDASVGLIVGSEFTQANQKVIAVSRRLNTADGQFAGEAILLLQPDNLITLNREVDIGRRGVIIVADIDGIILAGFDQDHVDGRLGVGIDLRGGAYPNHLDAGETAAYIRQARLDGVERLITVRSLTRYPLRVLVALDLDDVMASARSHVWLIVLVGLGATLLIGLLTLLLREVWRRTKREIELAHDRARLQLAQAQIEADRALLTETNRELLASKASAEAANRARTQFLAHMSHELRTPLHAIIGFSELIQDQAPNKPGSPPIAGYAADIWTSGRHLLELINTILDISKVESGTATLDETVFPVDDLVRNSVVSVRAQAEARNIPIELLLPESALRVRGDRTRLLQVLINLMANAVKFTPDEGRITLEAKETTTGELVFSVTDTGIGMTEAEIEIALEPFGQVDNTLSRSFEGTGLGLPLARKLTELHGGWLEVTSVKGKGTRVQVILPAERLRQPDGARV